MGACVGSRGALHYIALHALVAVGLLLLALAPCWHSGRRLSLASPVGWPLSDSQMLAQQLPGQRVGPGLAIDEVQVVGGLSPQVVCRPCRNT